MQNNWLHLDYIINVDKFQKIQDDISEVTELAILTVDYKGKAVTKHSKCSNFCKMIRLHPVYSQLCEKCDARGGLEAARLQQPYIYMCHIGILDFAIPIIIDGQYLGAVMAGQVLLKEEDEKEELERIVNDKYCKVNLDNEKDLKLLYNELPVMTLERVKSIANMVFHISNYIVEEAILKISLNELNEKILSLNSFKQTNIEFEKSNKTNILEDGEENNPVGATEQKPKNNEEKEESYKINKNSTILKPALEYILNKYSQTINLNKMASLCNISPSYFSKLFKKVIGENFSSYINKVRIKKAKEILESTDTPISNIALDLGFEDCGYFIKVFKKIEKVTPAAYRQRMNF